MPRRIVFPLIALAFAGALYLLLRQPARSEGRTVVVYSSADTEFALPIFEAFTKDTGIHVDYRFDGEETKVTALVKRLELMKGNPDGDVFWNSEQSCTLRLADNGVLQSYVSPNAASVPTEYKDAGGLWTGFGQRVRILLYNTDKVKPADVPKSLEDLSNPRWKGRFAIAKPLYGTSLSHFVALTLAIGEEKAFALFRSWRDNGMIVAQSNEDVQVRVSAGDVDIGMTDSDDAYSALDRKKPVSFVVIDQAGDWHGAFMIPNTVAILKNCPHTAEAKAFVDYLLRPETEKYMAENGARQIPVRDVGAKLPAPLNTMNLKPARVDLKQLGARVFELGERINKIFSGEEK